MIAVVAVLAVSDMSMNMKKLELEVAAR